MCVCFSSLGSQCCWNLPESLHVFLAGMSARIHISNTLACAWFISHVIFTYFLTFFFPTTAFFSLAGSQGRRSNPVAFQWRQGSPTDQSPAHHRALSEPLWGLVPSSRVPQQCYEGLLTHILLPPDLLCPQLGFEPKTSHFSAHCFWEHYCPLLIILLLRVFMQLPPLFFLAWIVVVSGSKPFTFIHVTFYHTKHFETRDSDWQAPIKDWWE